MDSIVKKLQQELPPFHLDGKGQAISWNASFKLLSFLEKYLQDGMRTIEIGSGYSTVVFIYKRCFHTCIVPSEYEVNRIKKYCRSNDIQLDRTEFIIDMSHNILPLIDKNNCDIILIDGAHRFPFPIVDWFFCADLLKNDGLIAIDDTDIISCHILLRFLLNDPHWEKIEYSGNFGIFRKLGNHSYPGDWPGQPFSRRKIIVPEDIMRAIYPSNNSEADVKLTLINKESKSVEDTCGNIQIDSHCLNANALPLSVIICTYNRSELLKKTLQSLTQQTLDRNDFEVILIDDGSSDNTGGVVASFSNELPIKYFYQNNSGLASAKNHGTYASKGKIVFFMDDDDIAMPNLLEEHVQTHEKYHEDNYAVLNHTIWADDLFITPIMNYITEVGCFLFSYPYIKHEDILDYTYFWGGRSSCKRSFLIEHGVFNQVFRFGCEDIELGYRLSKHGLKVVYNKKAISKMIRPINFDDFCDRLIKQGRSQYVFSNLHDDPEVHSWAEMDNIMNEWDKVSNIYDQIMRSANELDKLANKKLKYGFDIDEITIRLLHKAYWSAFKSCKLKGIIEMKNNNHNNQYIITSKKISKDLTKDVDYKKLIREEIDEYSNIEVTEDLREGGQHSHKAWEYWFRYLNETWQTSFGNEITTFCNSINRPRILSLGCGYGGIELDIARSLNKPYEIIGVDINNDLFIEAKERARSDNLDVVFKMADLNFIEIEENSFDVIFAHASLHHVLNLEHLCYQIHKGLKKDGRLVVLDIIGKTQVLFWKENVEFAIDLVKNMPANYKRGAPDPDNIIPPYKEPSIQKGMEGIRQEEIERELYKYFTPVKMFKYGSFMRLICTNPIIGKALDPDKEEDRKHLEKLFRLDLKMIKDGTLRPTEMFGVLKVK